MDHEKLNRRDRMRHQGTESSTLGQVNANAERHPNKYPGICPVCKIKVAVMKGHLDWIEGRYTVHHWHCYLKWLRM